VGLKKKRKSRLSRTIGGERDRDRNRRSVSSTRGGVFEYLKGGGRESIDIEHQKKETPELTKRPFTIHKKKRDRALSKKKETLYPSPFRRGEGPSSWERKIFLLLGRKDPRRKRFTREGGRKSVFLLLVCVKVGGSPKGGVRGKQTKTLSQEKKRVRATCGGNIRAQAQEGVAEKDQKRESKDCFPSEAGDTEEGCIKGNYFSHLGAVTSLKKGGGGRPIDPLFPPGGDGRLARASRLLLLVLRAEFHEDERGKGEGKRSLKKDVESSGGRGNNPSGKGV